MTERIGTDERGMRTEGQRRAARRLKQRRPAKGAKKFDPDQNYVEKAVDEYLKQGGKITRPNKKDKERSLQNALNRPISSTLNQEYTESPSTFKTNPNYMSVINFGSFQGRF